MLRLALISSGALVSCCGRPFRPVLSRRYVIAASVALTCSVLAAPAAQAQCSNTFNPSSTLTGIGLLPFAQGGSVNALVSVINTANTAFLTNTISFVSGPAGTKADLEGGGIWSRAIGGTVETKSTGVTTVDTSPFGFPKHRSEITSAPAILSSVMKPEFRRAGPSLERECLDRFRLAKEASRWFVTRQGSAAHRRYKGYCQFR